MCRRGAPGVFSWQDHTCSDLIRCGVRLLHILRRSWRTSASVQQLLSASPRSLLWLCSSKPSNSLTSNHHIFFLGSSEDQRILSTLQFHSPASVKFFYHSAAVNVKWTRRQLIFLTSSCQSQPLLRTTCMRNVTVFHFTIVALSSWLPACSDASK